MSDRIVALLAVAALLAGCSDRSGVNLANVSGVVTLDGQPVPGAAVIFQPRSGGQEIAGPGSTGYCDANGRFELRTIRNDPGAVVAIHDVTIYPNYASSGGNNSDVGGRSIVGPDIPRKYNYESTLTFEVPAEGTTSADFQLSSEQ